MAERGDKWITHSEYTILRGQGAAECSGALIFASVRANFLEASCDACSFIVGVSPEMLGSDSDVDDWWNR